MRALSAISISLFSCFPFSNSALGSTNLPTLQEVSNIEWSNLPSVKKAFGHLTPKKVPEEKAGDYTKPNIKNLFSGQSIDIGGASLRPTIRQENIGTFGLNLIVDSNIEIHEQFSCDRFTTFLSNIYGEPNVKNNKSLGNVEDLEAQWRSNSYNINSSCAVFHMENGAKFPLIWVSFSDKSEMLPLKEAIRLTCSNTQSQKINNKDEEITQQPPITIIIDQTYEKVSSSLRVGEVTEFNNSFIKTKAEETTENGLKLDLSMTIDRIQGTFKNQVIGSKKGLEVSNTNWGSCTKIDNNKKF